MKTRLLKNWVTTVIGATLIILSILFFFLGAMAFIPSHPFIFYAPAILLGWVFVMAKDSLIEGITLGVFSIKAK